jgi:quercetin dioxygenase-like cupin family protein
MNRLSHGVVRVIDSTAECPELPIVEGQGTAKVILWPGNGAEYRSIQLFTLEKGDRLHPMRHQSDCVYYIIKGDGVIVDLSGMQAQPLVEGSMIHIDAQDSYRIEAGDAGIRFLGGPCPPDAALYENLRAVGSSLA